MPKCQDRGGLMSVKRTRGPAADTRGRVLSGALECLREHGREGTSIAAVSRASGLSRPTIYAHFSTLDDLVHAAVERATMDLSRTISRELQHIENPGELLVEYVVAAHCEFAADRVVALVVQMTLEPQIAGAREISEAMYRFSGASLRRLLGADASEQQIDELVETLNRWLLS